MTGRPSLALRVDLLDFTHFVMLEWWWKVDRVTEFGTFCVMI